MAEDGVSGRKERQNSSAVVDLLSDQKSDDGLCERQPNRGAVMGFSFHGFTQLVVQPPSSISADPVINDEASEARNTTAPMTSSGRPSRPSLILVSTAAGPAR